MKKKGDKMVPNCVPEMNEKNKDMTAISTWKKNLKKVKMKVYLKIQCNNYRCYYYQ